MTGVRTNSVQKMMRVRASRGNRNPRHMGFEDPEMIAGRSWALTCFSFLAVTVNSEGRAMGRREQVTRDC